jgi:drug/metabolite transporter (DMT)-like permease
VAALSVGPERADPGAPRPSLPRAAAPDGPPAARRVPAPLLLAAAALFWSGNFVIGRAVAGRVPPVALAFWRWAVALAVLLPLSWRALRDAAPVLRRSWKILVPLGILGVGNFNLLVYVGLTETSATNALLLNSACPAFILAFSFATGLGRPTPRQLAGIALSLAGVATIVTRGAPSAVLSVALARGDLWVLAAVISWAAYTILLARRPASVVPLALLTALVAVGVLWITPFYAFELARGARLHLDVVSGSAILYVALFASIAAYALWNAGVGAIGASRAGVFLHLMPAFGSVLAAVLLGESFRPFHAAGIALILVGVTLAGAARSRTRRDG